MFYSYGTAKVSLPQLSNTLLICSLSLYWKLHHGALFVAVNGWLLFSVCGLLCMVYKCTAASHFAHFKSLIVFCKDLRSEFIWSLSVFLFPLHSSRAGLSFSFTLLLFFISFSSSCHFSLCLPIIASVPYYLLALSVSFELSRFSPTETVWALSNKQKTIAAQGTKQHSVRYTEWLCEKNHVYGIKPMPLQRQQNICRAIWFYRLLTATHSQQPEESHTK